MEQTRIQTHNDASYFEPAFYFASSNKGFRQQISMKSNFLPDSLAGFFEYQLRQKPDNLNCHLQRIEFFLYRKKINPAFSALCDLFIILGDSGQALRRRLWQSTQNYLDLQQQQILKPALNNKLKNNNPLLPSDCLFKNNPITLLSNIIQNNNSEHHTYTENEDILITINSYIENSQFDAALEYMTEHLQQEPDNKALTSKLISLYQAMDMKQEFAQAYDQFANQESTTQLWRDAQQRF